MDMNTIRGAMAYEKAATSKAEENLSRNENAVTHTKTEETAGNETAAAVYEKASKGTKKRTQADLDVINKMKTDLDKRKEQLRNLVEQMLNKQGKAFADATSMWEMLRSGRLEVDPAVAEQAQKDIAEDGYWGVEQTSERLVSFAKALAGNDPQYADKLIEAMKKGFGQAGDEWGGKLPDICKKTIETAISKMEAWRDGKDSAEAKTETE